MSFLFLKSIFLKKRYLTTYFHNFLNGYIGFGPMIMKKKKDAKKKKKKDAKKKKKT